MDSKYKLMILLMKKHELNIIEQLKKQKIIQKKQ